MKRKIHKIFGVALALVFAFSTTFAFSMPAMAAEEEWDLFEPPDVGADGDYFMDPEIDSLGPIAKAINDDLYVAVIDGITAGIVIDGTMSTGEWVGATTYNLVAGATPTAYVTNDDTYMYVAFDDVSIDGFASFNTYKVDAYDPEKLDAPCVNYDGTQFWDTLEDDNADNTFDQHVRVDGTALFESALGTATEFKVPLAELELAPGNSIQIMFVFFESGVASIYPAGADAQLPVADYEAFQLSVDLEVPGATSLMISDDGGRTWEETDYLADLGALTIIDIACSSEDADVLYVATPDNVHKTDDAGDSWSNLGVPRDGTDELVSATEVITCLAVGYADDEPHVFVGTEDSGSGDVYYYHDAPFAAVWTDLNVCGPDQSGTPAINTSDVFGIATSPKFYSDTLVVAVIYDDALDNSLVTANEGAGTGGLNDWDDVELQDDAAAPASITITDATNPVFVEDFDIDDDYELFVGVVGDAHSVGALGGVYRITGMSEDDDFLLDDVDDDITSLDLVGDLGGASLLAGTLLTATSAEVVGPASIWYSTDDGDSWDETDKAPTGLTDGDDGDAVRNLVIVADDFADSGEAWCASDFTVGGKEIGFHRTTDFGATWNGISLLDTNMAGDVYDIAFTADYGTDDAPMFMVTESDGDSDTADDSVWKYDGDNWERVWFDDTNELNLVEVSPAHAEDMAVFIAASDAPQILYSHDGGADFSAMIRDPDEAITAWLVIDDETIITGDAAGDYWKTSRYGRRVWDTGTICEGESITDLAMSPNYAADGTVLAGNDDSEVFISFDEGEEWDEVSASDIEGWTDADNDTYVAFDTRYADNSMIYAASDDIVARVEIDIAEDPGDLEFDNLSGASPDEPAALTTGADQGAGGIVVADDGTQAGEDVATLYVLDAVTGVAAIGGTTPIPAILTGVWRCLNPADTLADVIFELASAELITEDFSPVVGSIRNLELAGGSNVLYAISTVAVEAVPDVIYTYEDTLAAPVVLSSPADGEPLVDTERAEFEWEDLNVDTVDLYQISVNEEDDFPSATDEDVGTVDTAGVALSGTATSDLHDDNELIWRDASGGTEYFWKVRVAEGGPVLSRWSVARTFMTKVEEVTAPVEVRPLPGAQEVILMPAFAWEAVTGADTYEIEVATDSEFADLVTAGVSTINTWIIDVELDYATAYYWRVRGISSTGAPEGDWVVSVFTTMEKPAEAPAPVKVEIPPAQAAPDITVETIIPITPAYIWSIIVIGALLIIALIVLIVRTRRVM